MEDYFERVVETLTGAGYRWYETANFCRARRRARPPRAAQPRLLARPRLPRDRGRRGLDGRRPAAGGTRRACRATSPRSRGASAPARELEPLDADDQARERVLLGLRLDEPLATAGLDDALDHDALARLERLGLAEVRERRDVLALTRRGRFLGGGVTAELLV